MLPIKIKLLIIAKFEIGGLGNGKTGEGELFFKHYFSGGDAFEVKGLAAGDKLHVRGNAAMFVSREGKINAALTTTAVLCDPRFDFSETFILSVGCAGTCFETTVMGDVVIGSAVVNGESGHTVLEAGKLKWFPPETPGTVVKILNQKTSARAFELAGNIPLKTTEKTRAFMKKSNAGPDRGPKVLLGTVFTTDNYWKGRAHHDLAKEICSRNACPHAYKASEMEDAAVAAVAERFGLLDRLIVVRVSVNLDNFMNGATPEKLWENRGFSDNMTDENNHESADIFVPAMQNLFNAGKIIADAVLAGTF